jgi:hypothetical protein
VINYFSKSYFDLIDELRVWRTDEMENGYRVRAGKIQRVIDRIRIRRQEYLSRQEQKTIGRRRTNE